MPALQKFEVGGSESFLNELQRQALDQHPHENLYLFNCQRIRAFCQTNLGSYSESGITQFLSRMDYVYKKPKLVPGKVDAGKQRTFVECYEEYGRYYETFLLFKSTCRDFMCDEYRNIERLFAFAIGQQFRFAGTRSRNETMLPTENMLEHGSGYQRFNTVIDQQG